MDVPVQPRSEASELTRENNGFSTTDISIEEDEDFNAMTTEIMVPSAIGLSILILVGVAGNVMTILAYFENRRHNKVYDFFILNLAITDLILCSITMPFYTIYTLMEFTWPFGYWFCKINLLIDFTACTEATLLILILSLDRLVMISLRTFYIRKVTWKVAVIVLTVSWIISLLYYVPAILAWNYLVGYTTVEYMDCDVEFAFENVFVITMSILDFVLPSVLLIIMNGLLFYKIWRWANIRQHAFKQKTKSIKALVIPNERRNASARSVTMEAVNQTSQDGHLTLAVVGNGRDLQHADVTTKQTETGTSTEGGEKTTTQTGTGAEGNANMSKSNKGKLKSAKFLIILVLAFLFFWSPYTITTMVISICNECVNTSLHEIFIWVLWMKSAVNPLLYAFHIPRYRQCFKRYITLNGRIWKSCNQRR